MNILFNKIMHIATGLASVGFAVLCILAAFFAATIAAVVFLLITSVGLLFYGVPAYVWGFVSVVQNKFSVEPPLLLMRFGLLLVLIGIIGVVIL